jgi:hypothetical protein
MASAVDSLISWRPPQIYTQPRRVCVRIFDQNEWKPVQPVDGRKYIRCNYNMEKVIKRQRKMGAVITDVAAKRRRRRCAGRCRPTVDWYSSAKQLAPV